VQYTTFSLFPSATSVADTALCAPPFAVSRSCCGIRLALADGGSLPFSLYPPLAALESQTRQGKGIRRFAVRSDSILWHYSIKMCRYRRHTLTLPPAAAKHNPPERRT